MQSSRSRSAETGRHRAPLRFQSYRDEYSPTLRQSFSCLIGELGNAYRPLQIKPRNNERDISSISTTEDVYDSYKHENANR